MMIQNFSQRLSDGQRQSLDRILAFGERFVDWLSPLLAIFLLYYLYKEAPELSRVNLKLYTFALMWIGLVSSWNLIGGYTGYIDFGHAVFFGFGGYTVGILLVKSQDVRLLGDILDVLPFDTYTFWGSLPVAFVVGALIAGVMGYPALRLKGPYFAIAMLGMLVAGREIVRNNPWGITNGGIGISFRAPFPQPLTVFQVMLAIAGFAFFMSYWMYRTQFGQMLRAIRDDEVGADMRGINTTLIKITVFMLAGGITAMLGGTRAWWDGYTEADLAFPAQYTIQMIMMAMLGGIGRPWGAVIGAALFYYAEQSIWANLSGVHLVVTGVLLIFIVMFMPSGILGLLDPENRGLSWRFRQLRAAINPTGEMPTQHIPEAEVTPSPSPITTPHNHKTGEVVLEGRKVVKDFGGLRAVNQVNFEIHKGEIVGLLGPNGSGKTTLFNCISGVNPATSGTILLRGEDVTRRAPWQISRRFLSRTFQKIRIYDRLTVFENMLLGRQWRGIPPWLWLWIAPPSVRNKARDLMDILRLSHVRHNLASNLSGGQQRLLEIGVALMSDPAVVLLDEATSGVNPALVEEIKEDIRRLNQEHGVTFFLVEHNMNFAMELCERLYVLDYGSVIAEGTPEVIQNDPAVIEAYFGRDE